MEASTRCAAIVQTDAFVYRRPINWSPPVNEKAPRHRTELSRRRLLSGLGSLTVALTSPVWRPATAFGADTAAAPGAQRFMVMFSANGTVPTSFFPTAPAGAAETPLTTMSPILTPLDPYKAKLVVMKGVHMSSANVPQPGGPHMKGPGAMLTGGKLNAGSFRARVGWPLRRSYPVDQAIADKIGTGTTYKSMEFGVRTIGPSAQRHLVPRIEPAAHPVNDPWQMQPHFCECQLVGARFGQAHRRAQSVPMERRRDAPRMRVSLKIRIGSTRTRQHRWHRTIALEGSDPQVRAWRICNQ